jgi:hypothetical protein
MNEKTQLLQVRLVPSVIAKVKELGNGKFAAGLAVLLAQTTPKGKPAKEDDPLHPGDTYQATAKRAREAHANSPETRRAKYRPQIERYLKENYSRYGGVVDEDTEYTPYELSKDGMTPINGTPIRIMDYITEEERDEWVEAGRIYALGDRERNTVSYRNDEYRPKPVTRTKQLTADSRHMYQNDPNLMAGLTDAQIDMMNDECDGAIDRGDDPIDTPTAENTN